MLRPSGRMYIFARVLECRYSDCLSMHLSQAIVRADTPAIDEALKRLCAEDPERLCIESEESIEILTPQYIDSLAKIIHETATQKGRVTIDELSATFNLPANVSQRNTRARLPHTHIHRREQPY